MLQYVGSVTALRLPQVRRRHFRSRVVEERAPLRKCAFIPASVVLGIVLASMTNSAAQGSVVVREPLEQGAYAAIRGGRVLFLECSPPSGNAAQAFLGNYLSVDKEWRLYKDRMAVAIPYNKLNAKTQRRLLEAVFPLDYVDEHGWWHTVRFSGRDGTESMFSIAEWLTGSGAEFQRILSHKANSAISEPLVRGMRILIPQPFLLPVMKAFSPPPPPPPSPIVPSEEPQKPQAVTTPTTGNGVEEGLLEYREDRQGRFALYRLRPGESLYSAVVVRFTDYRENADILQACEIIQKRSGIRNVHRMNAGQSVLIPIEMLSDRYQPVDSEQRRAYEFVREEARRLRAQHRGAKDLDGVVIILDPGHGGRDQGAAIEKLGLLEDEINYDIVCRIKELLETRTRAKTYVTVLDPNQSYAPTNATRFTHDANEAVLTTPPYRNDDAKVSANLRWYLANDIFFREKKNGVDERNIIFASIHCDALFNDSLRGAMIYVPGNQYRRDTETPSGSIYGRFEEARRNPTARSTAAQRKRDEALSRNFAGALLTAMRNNNPPIKVHDAGDPIRHVIRQSGGRAYLPAVLRNSAIPTKVLIEVANMTNPTDQKHLADPQWRQWFAEAFVEAIRLHYSN